MITAVDSSILFDPRVSLPHRGGVTLGRWTRQQRDG